MAQQFGTFTALAGNPGLVSSTHMAFYKGSDFCLLAHTGSCTHMVHINSHGSTNTHENNK